jgi:hypothetical protein
MALNTFLTLTCVVFVLNNFNVSRLPDFAGTRSLCNVAEHLPDCDPRRVLFLIILMFLGYRISTGTKSSCNAAKRLPNGDPRRLCSQLFYCFQATGYSAGTKSCAMPLNAFLTSLMSSLVSTILMFLGYRIFRGYKSSCNAAERLPDGDPRRLLFLTFLLFPGYRIFRGYKELFNAAECLPDVTHVVFVFYNFDVSRLPDISRFQRAVQCH